MLKELGQRSTFLFCFTLFLAAVAWIATPATQAEDSPGHAHPGVQVTDTHLITHSDKVPRFCSAGRSTHMALRSGSWSNPATWGGQVPGAEARVVIPRGVTVIYDIVADTPLDCIEVGAGGSLVFATDKDTRLRINNLQVLPGMAMGDSVMPGGILQIGTEQNPIQPDVVAEIILRDSPLETGTVEIPGRDPEQFGQQIGMFGTWRVHGAPRDPTFVRTAREPRAGEIVLHLEQPPAGWRAGDVVVLPDTRQVPIRKRSSAVSQTEERVIRAVSGTRVELKEPLTFDHLGARRADGTPEPGFLPHVGNLTRNVRIRSENPEGTRGHTMVFHRADVDIRYGQFVNLGRTKAEKVDSAAFDEAGRLIHIGTNQIARYPLHTHHLIGPKNPSDTGYQFRLIGNVVQRGKKWGITIHGSSYGRIAENIVYDLDGAGIAGEDGNEAFNEFDHNLVIGRAPGETRAGTPHGDCPGDGPRGSVSRDNTLNGISNDGFWFRGPMNTVRNNVVATVDCFGINYNGYYWRTDSHRFPKFRGADLAMAEESLELKPTVPLLESRDNEIYAGGVGLWATWYQGCCDIEAYTRGTFQGYRMWNLSDSGVYTYHVAKMTFEGFVMRNDVEVSRQSEGNAMARLNTGWFFNVPNYENGGLVVSGFDTQGFNIGIQTPPNLTGGSDAQAIFRYGFLKNHINVLQSLPKTPVRIRLENVRFERVPMGSFSVLPAGSMNFWMSTQRSNSHHPMRVSELFVRGYNGQTGDDFQIYFEAQAPQALVLPPARPDLHAGDPTVTCPEEGLTNAECWRKYGVATGGRPAPCGEVDGDDCQAAAARAQLRDIFGGLLFPIREDITAPVATDLAVFPGDRSAILFWRTAEPADSQVWYSEYAGSEDFGKISFAPIPLADTLTRTHSVTLTGLKPQTRYAFIVRSKDASGNLVIFGRNRNRLPLFTTLAEGAPPPQPPQPPLRGDVNQDGVVNLRDAIQLLRWITGQPGRPEPGTDRFLTADVNRDGRLTLADFICLLRGIVAGTLPC